MENPKLNLIYLEKYKRDKSKKVHDKAQVILDEFGLDKIKIWGA